LVFGGINQCDNTIRRSGTHATRVITARPVPNMAAGKVLIMADAGTGGMAEGHGAARPGPARRGEARYVLLDALRDGPKHGYEIIKHLEERSGGEYAPSPGTVYPTLQYLEDAGQVRSEQSAERRVYHLTDAGRAELEARAEDLQAFWAARLAGPPATSAAAQRHPEIDFVAEELDALSRTVWGGLRNAWSRTIWRRCGASGRPLSAVGARFGRSSLRAHPQRAKCDNVTAKVGEYRDAMPATTTPPAQFTPDLEQAFQARYYAAVRPTLRVVAGLLAVLFLVYAGRDYYDTRSFVLAARQDGVPAAFFLLLVGLSFWPGFGRVWQPFLMAGAWIVAALALSGPAALFAGALGPPPGPAGQALPPRPPA
jgi:DNA-binding PadR family transcriptional regulator